MNRFFRQFVYKFIANLLKMALSILSLLIVPNTLGVASYGLYELLNSNFQNLSNILTFGSNSAFFSKISRRPLDKRLINFYIRFNLIIFLFFSLISFIVYYSFNSWNSDIIVSPVVFFLAMMVGIFQLYNSILRDTSDAYHLTRSSEIYSIIFSILGLLLTLILIALNILDIQSLFMKDFVIVLIFSIVLFVNLYKNYKRLLLSSVVFSTNGNIRMEFWEYCKPFVSLTLFTSGIAIFQRWILQLFAGSVEQGVFSLGLRISMFGVVFINSLTSLLFREVSVLHSESNNENIKIIIHKSLRTMYFVVGVISIFVSVYADQIVHCFFSSEYNSLSDNLKIISLYAMHQVYGQFLGSFLLSMGHTKPFRNISFFTIFLNLFLTLYFIAPNEFFGQDMGSKGLSWSLVISNIISVNLSLLYLKRKLSIDFSGLLCHQLMIFLLLYSICLVSHFIINMMFLKGITLLIIGGMIYILLLLLILMNSTLWDTFDIKRYLKLLKK
jgi:O-antigen/teichoic acid export membrane protein